MLLRFRLSEFFPVWIAAAFGIVGIVLLGVSLRGAQQRVEELRSWSSIEARVDAGDVVSLLRRGRREAVYAERLQLRYEFGGHQYNVAATEAVYSSGYAGQARGVQRAVRAGTVPALVDPAQPAEPVLHAGYNPEFFFGSLVTGWIGVVFVVLATLLWRAFRAKPPGATTKGWFASGVWLVVFFTVMGVLFTTGGATAFYLAQREQAWRPVDASVDSTDVVWKNGRSSNSSGATSGSTPIDLYAARAWITYGFRGSVYHVPVVRGAYSNDSSGAAGMAATLGRSGSISALFDPGNPFDARVGRPGAVRRFWLPALFIVPGLICLLLAWLFGRKKRTRRPRKTRRRMAVAT